MKWVVFLLLLIMSVNVAMANSLADDPSLRVTVKTDTAELCLPHKACHKVLIGKGTPKGIYPLNVKGTRLKGYGGNVLVFKEEGDYVYAIHRLYLGNPKEQRDKKIQSENVSERILTNGCINVSDELYTELKNYFSVEIL